MAEIQTRVLTSAVAVAAAGVALTAASCCRKFQRKVLGDRPAWPVPGVQDSPSLFAPLGKLCQHDVRRQQAGSYPPTVPNTWYHLLDSHEVVAGAKPIHLRALGQDLAVWRSSEGRPVVMSAFCPHMGANLAAPALELHKNPKGKTSGDCVECPFHGWRFDANGSLVDVPYLPEGDCLPQGSTKVRTYRCADWCGLLLMYFHADQGPEDEPEFPLPNWIAEQIQGTGGCDEDKSPYHFLKKWDVGFVRLSPTDLVDQAGDHCHFHTLHNWLSIPYTMIFLPLKLVETRHKLATVLGEKAEQTLREANKFIGQEQLNSKYLYFTDTANVDLAEGRIVSPNSSTVEMYCGAAMILFHIPLGDTGMAVKAFVTTTPVEGGSVVRVRTWFNRRNPLMRLLAWLTVGISATQLAADIEIIENKHRPRKPNVTKHCGPVMAVNRWLKQFYSEGSSKINTCGSFPDW